MSRLQTLLDRLPRLYAQDEDSNNYKLMKIVASATDETRVVYDTIQKFWDIDRSEGIGLDRLGKDEGISRGGWDDEEYRKMIKIQCVINLSEGDIPTMNLILDTYMEGDFIGFQDAFHTVFEEPAAIVGHVKINAPSPPSSLIKRLKSAGVRLYWMRTFDVQKLILSHFVYRYPIYYHKCGELVTAPILGLGIGSIIGLPELQYRYPVYYNPSDTFYTTPIPGANLSGGVSMMDYQYDYPNYYPATNVIESEAVLKGAFTGTETNMLQTTASMRMMAPICGIFTGGGM